MDKVLKESLEEILEKNLNESLEKPLDFSAKTSERFFEETLRGNPRIFAEGTSGRNF